MTCQHRTMRFFVILLLIAGHPMAMASPVFSDGFSARYSLIAKGTPIGRSNWSLKRNGALGFVYESRTEAIGLLSLIRDERIVERSEWQLETDRSARPVAYRYRRSGGKKDRDVQIAFDWSNGLARTTASGETWQMPVPEGTFDKLGYVLALMHDLGQGKQEMHYSIADGGKLKTYQLQTIGSERLDTALGSLQTVKVRRLRGDNKRQTTLWCAVGLSFLPVKVEHREKDGSVLFLRIESVTGLGTVELDDKSR